jgi:hypothetical protein
MVADQADQPSLQLSLSSLRLADVFDLRPSDPCRGSRLSGLPEEDAETAGDHLPGDAPHARSTLAACTPSCCERRRRGPTAGHEYDRKEHELADHSQHD